MAILQFLPKRFLKSADQSGMTRKKLYKTNNELKVEKNTHTCVHKYLVAGASEYIVW